MVEDNHEEPAGPAGSSGEKTQTGEFDTVGTGSIFAIGCTILTLIVVLAGVALFIFRQVG